MKRAVSCLAVGLAAVAAFTTAALVADARVGSVGLAPAITETFHDGAAEDPSAPDINTVVVLARAGGVVSFRVGVANRPTLTEDMRMRIWLDVDDNPSTGLSVDDRRGFDYFLLVDRWELGLGVARLFTCSVTVCKGGAQVGFTYAGGGTFTVETSGLKLRPFRRVRFFVEASSGWTFDPAKGYDFTNVHADVAPDAGQYWIFAVPPLMVSAFDATPVRPRAGHAFALRLSAVRTASGAVARGRLGCSLTAGGARLTPRVKGFVDGIGVCEYRIPLSAKGKRYRGVISISVGADRVRQSLRGTIG